LKKDLFKEITEAYSILGDADKRARYDQLIFGDSSRGDFDNQEAYEYWKDRKQPDGSGKMRDPLRDQQERVRDRLKNYKDYEDFLNRYEHHREKSGAREHLMRGEGFKEMNQKYGTEYDFYEKAD
jgi:curved DNA-binding protein CbpA